MESYLNCKFNRASTAASEEKLVGFQPYNVGLHVIGVKELEQHIMPELTIPGPNLQHSMKKC